jgi:hypothetical protein
MQILISHSDCKVALTVKGWGALLRLGVQMWVEHDRHIWWFCWLRTSWLTRW